MTLINILTYIDAGLQCETPWNDLKRPIRVKVGGVECFVESQHVSNCDFKEVNDTIWQCR